MIIDKLIEIKEAKGWTNQKLADESGVPLSTVTRVCNRQTDNPSIKNVEDMMNALGTSIEEVLGVKNTDQKFEPDDNLIKLYKDMIRTKDKYIKFLSITIVSIVVFLIIVLLVDLGIHDIGYVRR